MCYGQAMELKRGVHGLIGKGLRLQGQDVTR